MCYLNSNIPSKIFYASISSQNLPISRKTTDLINLVTRIFLVTRFVNMYEKVNVPVSFHYIIIEKDL